LKGRDQTIGSFALGDSSNDARERRVQGTLDRAWG
jgi:hypothetical protein